MFKIKKIRSKNKAVSEVLGTVLLLLISVTLFSAVYISFFSIEIKPSTPSVNIVGTIEKNRLVLEHRGGESLSLNTEIILRYNGGTTQSIQVNNGSYLVNQHKNDGKWNIGERFAYPLSELSNFARFDPINVTVVDVESNSILMTGAVIEPRVADITLKMSVSDDEPAVGDDITVTIKVKNDKGPSDAKDILIKYPFGAGLRTGDRIDPMRFDVKPTGMWTGDNYFSMVAHETGIFGIVTLFLLYLSIVFKGLKNHFIIKGNNLQMINASAFSILLGFILVSGFFASPQNFMFWILLGILITVKDSKVNIVDKE